MVVGLLALTGGFWFAILSPKRKESQKLTDQVAVEVQRLETARTTAKQAEESRARYGDDYATVARLGKAVPVQDDVPSLVYQLETTAKDNNIDFRSIKLDSKGAAAVAAPATAPPAAGAAAAGEAEKKPEDSGSTGDSSSADSSAAATAPATGAAAATLPPGAAVGPAGFPIMPFSFTFDGSFFSMESFLRAIDRFTTVTERQLTVRGRLLTFDGVAITASRKGFPKVKAAVAATAYLLPADQGLTAGATPQGPATPAPSDSGSSGSSSPVPTAAAR